MLKKLLSILLIVVLIFSLSACVDGAKTKKEIMEESSQEFENGQKEKVSVDKEKKTDSDNYISLMKYFKNGIDEFSGKDYELFNSEFKRITYDKIPETMESEIFENIEKSASSNIQCFDLSENKSYDSIIVDSYAYMTTMEFKVSAILKNDNFVVNFDKLIKDLEELFGANLNKETVDLVRKHVENVDISADGIYYEFEQEELEFELVYYGYDYGNSKSITIMLTVRGGV